VVDVSVTLDGDEFNDRSSDLAEDVAKRHTHKMERRLKSDRVFISLELITKMY
jgi:hypothetical protein